MNGTLAARAARPPPPWFLSWPGLALIAALALAWRGSGGNLRALLSAEARSGALDFLRGFWPPAHDSDILSTLPGGLAQTVAIGMVGLGLALLLGAPLSLLATSPDVLEACGQRRGPGHRTLHAAARGVLALMRSIPEMIWALLFVRAVGLGPLPGVLALGIAYGGVIGKVFADLFETVPRASAEALAASGARPWAAFAFGIVPAARPLVISYTLYRFDCALRASAVLGLVGAGGIGQQIELSLRMLRYDEVATYVLALFILVAAVDAASQALRRRVERSGSLFPDRSRAALRRLLGVATVAVAVALAGKFLDIEAGSLFSRAALRSFAAFARSLWPPDLSPEVLRAVVPAAWETLAMSLLGTAIAAMAGIVLAYLAARPLRRLDAEERPAWQRAPGVALALLARGILNLGRTLPELIWALVFVLSIGLGPFAGALALGVHTAGVLGRLYFEAFEEVPSAPLAALRASGASAFATAAHGVLPQVFPQLVSYTLYRWEVNIRASAVLGVVGAGGLGRDLRLALSWFDSQRAATLVLALLVLVLVVDGASAAIRRRLQGLETPQTERALAV